MEEVTRPPLSTYEDLAKRIDHSLLAPSLTEEEVHNGCRLARELGVASVCVRPSDADLVVRWLDGSGIPVASVAGFPHGSQTTAVKLYEARDLLRRGVREIEAALNTGKLVSRQFQYIESELLQLTETCREAGAVLKIVFETAYLTTEHKIVACKMCRLAGVDFAVTSTGFAPAGYTLEDLQLIKPRLKERVQLKAAGGVDRLETVLEAYAAGADRFGTAASSGILAAWRSALERKAKEAASQPGEPR